MTQPSEGASVSFKQVLDAAATKITANESYLRALEGQILRQLASASRRLHIDTYPSSRWAASSSEREPSVAAMYSVSASRAEKFIRDSLGISTVQVEVGSAAAIQCEDDPRGRRIITVAEATVAGALDVLLKFDRYMLTPLEEDARFEEASLLSIMREEFERAGKRAFFCSVDIADVFEADRNDFELEGIGFSVDRDTQGPREAVLGRALNRAADRAGIIR